MFSLLSNYLRRIDSELLEDLDSDGDGRVNRVGNDTNNGVRCGTGSGGGQISNNGSVSGEKVITGHSRLAGNSGGNKNNISSSDGGFDGLSVSTLVTFDTSLKVLL